MKELYGQMLGRWLAVESWDQWEMSPLEAVVWQEWKDPEDARRVHDHIFRLLLKEIARLEKEAAEYGGGEQDWRLASFHRVLKDAGEADESGPESLPPKELARRKRAAVYKKAAMVYPLRKQGMSLARTAGELGISEEDVRNAEGKLLRLFRKTTAASGCRPPAALREARTRTLAALEQGTYRVFHRKTETGIQYRFYCRDRLMGTGSGGTGAGASLVLRRGALVFYSSSFDPDSTLFPGISRTVVDADDPITEAARLIWLEPGRYELHLNWDPEPVTVRVEEDRFFCNDRPVAEILSLQEPQKIGEWETGFCMKPCEPLSDETALLLMSFPLLRFAL